MKREVRILFCVLCVCLTTVALFGCGKKTPPKGQNQEQRKALDDNDMERLFEMVENEEGYTIKKYLGEEKELDIPDKYRGEFITKILPNAFNQSDKLEKVKIPSRVETIGQSAFHNCSALKSVTLNNALKKIESSAFEQTSIEKITFPSTVEKIGSRAFYKCYALQTVTLNEGLKEIGRSAFSGTSIEEITIPGTVEKVDSLFGDAKIKVNDGNAKYEAIDNCLIEKATKKLISGGKYSLIPEGIKEIGKHAFWDSSIEIITIPSTVEKIGSSAFSRCKKLKTVTLNEGLKEIEFNAFQDTSIESITIPSTVEKIGSSAFSRCKKLKTVTLNEGLKEIEYEAFRETSIESITIPSTVEKIESLAFGFCTKLKTVTLNEGLKEIEFNAFSGTSIESITIPSTVEGIGFSAFSGCSKLTQIDCKLRKSYVESNRNDFRGLLEKESIINWLNG